MRNAAIGGVLAIWGLVALNVWGVFWLYLGDAW
jgi:hypothetical protein